MLTDQQKLDRTKGIGGSDVAAILGKSQYKSALQVYMDKLGLSQDVDLSQNQYVYFGNKLESIIRDVYLEKTGLSLCVDEGTIQSKEHDFMFANVDAIVHGVDTNTLKVLECKTASPYTIDKWGEPGSDIMPDEYLLQCAHYSIVTGIDKVDLAVLIGGNDFRIYNYEKNQKLHDIIVEKEYNFWHNHVLKNIPPEPTSLNDLKLYQAIEDEVYIADGSIINDASDFKAINDELKRLEKLKEEVALKIQTKMKSATVLLNGAGDVLATWKERQAARINQKFLKENYPDVAANCTEKSSYRVFLIK